MFQPSADIPPLPEHRRIVNLLIHPALLRFGQSGQIDNFRLFFMQKSIQFTVNITVKLLLITLFLRIMLLAPGIIFPVAVPASHLSAYPLRILHLVAAELRAILPALIRCQHNRHSHGQTHMVHIIFMPSHSHAHRRMNHNSPALRLQLHVDLRRIGIIIGQWNKHALPVLLRRQINPMILIPIRLLGNRKPVGGFRMKPYQILPDLPAQVIMKLLHIHRSCQFVILHLHCLFQDNGFLIQNGRKCIADF